MLRNGRGRVRRYLGSTSGHRNAVNRGVQITFLRRFLGLERPTESSDREEDAVAPQAPTIPPPRVAAVACPYCGISLDPPPEHSRLCPRCRRQIVVRHSEGRAIYLTEAAVEVFESERQREIDEQRWTRERRRWLRLAQQAGAPHERRRRLAIAKLSAESVAASRGLYLAAADRAVRAARRNKRWTEIAQIRRRQAAALFEEAGGKSPPTDDIVSLYREGVSATLRAIALVSRDAELVGAGCCRACRADNERIFRITDEVRTPRLPHAGCPRGLCACDWWPALSNAAPKRRRLRSSQASSDPAGAGEAPSPASAIVDGPVVASSGAD